MKKNKLTEATNANMEQTREALRLLWDNVNKGQKKQILKKPEVKDMFDRYGVKYEE